MAVYNIKGLALIVVIIIIVIAAIIVFGIATFISSGLSLNIAKSSMEQALFAAQAGVYAAIYDYIANPAQLYWTKVRGINVSGNIYYSVGKDANFLLIDASNPEITARTIRRIPLRNINETQTITADQMIVEWYNFNGANLDQVRLGGVERWQGTAASGQRIPLNPPFQLDVGDNWSDKNDNRWRFNTAVPDGITVIVTFFFTDDSSRKAYLYNLGRGGNNEFSIIATGEVRGLTTWRRTIEATYDVGADSIGSWQETQSHI